MADNNYSSPFNPKQIERETRNRLLRTSILSLFIIVITLMISITLFPRAAFLQPTAEGEESVNQVDWSLLEGIASLVAVSLVLGGLAFAFTEYIQNTIQQRRESAETSFNMYKEVYYRLMNENATAARRWIILNLPTRKDQEDDQAWLKRTTAALEKSPVGWEGERPPGKEYLKEVLNTLDFIGFVSKHYWNMENELATWMSSPIVKVWERIYLYVEHEALERNEPDFYKSAREFGQNCVEWREKYYPKSIVIPDAT